MSFFKRRAWPGRLALVCLLTGFFTASPIPAMDGRVIASNGPDLIIESITCSPETPTLRDTVTFTVTIKNQGDSRAPLSRIAYYIDDSLISTADINPIDAGNTAVNVFTWQVIAGEHSIKAVIDSNNAIAEINEDNNVKVYVFSVLAADLIIESITWSPEIASAGDTVTFTVTLKNHGSKTAGFCSVEFFIDGSSRGQREGARLEPGASKTIDYTWITQPGQHTIKGSADILNQAVESDETNNDLSLIYSTTPPDLIIDSITWSPENYSETENVTMSVTVKNQGLGAANGSWLAYYIDGKLQTTVFINSLAADAIDTETYSWLVGSEEHTFTATIDADKWVAESDESNNTRSITLPALGLPDLLIQSITWSPEAPTIDSRMTFTITIENAGKRTVDKCDIDFYITYDFKVSGQTGPIPAGGTASLSFQYITSTVPVKVRAIVDPNHFIAESDESNNEMTASLTPVEPTPATDFVVTSLTCTPENPAIGDTVTITASIINNGTEESGESHIAYYVDGVLLSTVFLNKLAPGATGTNSITWTATIGKHTIRAVADYNNYISETDESNNMLETTLATLAPDLVIKSITWSPEIPSKGDALTITLTIINQGTLKSAGCYVSYYADGSYQGNHYIEEIAPGETVTRTFPWTYNKSLTFKAVIDKENSVIESNESNNEKTAVIPAPDLTIEAITWSPAEYSENDTVTFLIMVKNIGVSQAESPYVDCYINDVLQSRLPVNSISPGASAAVIFYWKAQSGENVFRAIADGTDSITESDETNNEKIINLWDPGASTEIIPAPVVTTENTTVNVTSNETQEILAAISDTSELPPAQNEEIPPINPTDIAANTPQDVSDTPTDNAPQWKNILMNRWIIIGVGALGGAGILVLLLMRRRAQTA